MYAFFSFDLRKMGWGTKLPTGVVNTMGVVYAILEISWKQYFLTQHT